VLAEYKAISGPYARGDSDRRGVGWQDGGAHDMRMVRAWYFNPNYGGNLIGGGPDATGRGMAVSPYPPPGILLEAQLGLTSHEARWQKEGGDRRDNPSCSNKRPPRGPYRQFCKGVGISRYRFHSLGRYCCSFPCLFRWRFQSRD